MMNRLLTFLLAMVVTIMAGIFGVACFDQASSPSTSFDQPDELPTSPAVIGAVTASPLAAGSAASAAGPATAVLEGQPAAAPSSAQPPTLTPIPTSLPAADNDPAVPMPANPPAVIESSPTPMPTDLPAIIDPSATPFPTAQPTAVTASPTSRQDGGGPLGGMTFAVIGDYGSDFQGTHDVAALVRSWAPDFIITVGDNNYPDGAAETMGANVTQHYGDYVADGRFFPTLGNHDYYTAGAQPYFDYFDLPNNERYYEFVRGDVHFFAINSDWNEPDGISRGSPQASWLQEAMANSTARWQVVYFHVAPFSSREASQVDALRWPFAAWGADLVLSGHAHVYERLLVDNIPYIVNGVGGHSIYAFDEVSSPYSQVRYNGDFGALRVDVSAAAMTLQFVTRAGRVIDTYTLFAP